MQKNESTEECLAARAGADENGEIDTELENFELDRKLESLPPVAVFGTFEEYIEHMVDRSVTHANNLEDEIDVGNHLPKPVVKMRIEELKKARAESGALLRILDEFRLFKLFGRSFVVVRMDSDASSQVQSVEIPESKIAATVSEPTPSARAKMRIGRIGVVIEPEDRGVMMLFNNHGSTQSLRLTPDEASAMAAGLLNAASSKSTS